MRYLFLTGGLTLVLAIGLAVTKTGDAFGQQRRVEYLQTQSSQVPIVLGVGQQIQQVDHESDETTRLSALDAQLGQQAESLVKQLAEATEENDRAKLKQSLQETLAQQFDTQQKVRELEVASVEARVKKLRDVITKRNDARRSIIDRRLDQLVREAEGLGWNSPAGGPVLYGQHVRAGATAAAQPPVSLATPRAK